MRQAHAAAARTHEAQGDDDRLALVTSPNEHMPRHRLITWRDPAASCTRDTVRMKRTRTWRHVLLQRKTKVRGRLVWRRMVEKSKGRLESQMSNYLIDKKEEGQFGKLSVICKNLK